ncbi:uncharacterized protein [Drosophila takahashii]|uniref:uncharacterized protein n=1 Tax=Drosophila takahashii TaxID=29030 RepID=UPI0007E65F7E|nr:uncharacterized protein LOC108064256 [Drosophila takahashii]
MGHRNICCDGCQRRDFRGRRFRCLRCVNFDLCGDCYDQRLETQDHRFDHPMQLILDPSEDLSSFLLNGQVPEIVHLSNCFTCPYCRQSGQTAKRLIEHVCAEHRLSEDYVVCPLCAGLPGVELVAICNLSRHLLLNHIDHANFLEPDSPPLRRIFARSRIRRRRQVQTQSRGFDLILQLSTVENQLPPSIIVDPPEEKQPASLVIAEPKVKKPAEQYLLMQFMEQQEILCQQETEMTGSQRRRHALFAEHLIISLLCSEELQLPEEKKPVGLSKVMSVMSLPWTRAWQATQLGGLEGEGPRIEIPPDDGKNMEKVPAEEAID